MEHPILFLPLLLQKLGLPVVLSPDEAHTFLQKLLLPHVIHGWLVMGLLILLAWLVSRKLEVVPGKGQNIFEAVLTGIEDFMVGVVGEEGRFLFPLIASLGLFIFVSNYLGLIPGFYSPTANLNTTLACAIIVVVFTHVLGVKYHGIKYIKHFLGPVPLLIPLIFPIEVISHLARVVSLSVRLFGNIFGEELVLAVLFFLAGVYMAPLPMLGLALFTGFIQAFIFVVLSLAYFAGAMEEAHH